MGLWAVLAAVVGLGALALAACDNGVTLPTRVSSASPVAANATEGTGPVETGTISTILTEVPGVPTPTAVPSPVGVDAQAAVQIYAQVVTALLGRESPPYVYISPYIGQGERLDDPDENIPIPQKILSALPTSGGHPIYGIEDFASSIGPLDDGGKVKNDGVFITLGAIAVDESAQGVVVVRGSIYRKVGNAEGDRFRLQKDPSTPGGWKVLDTTQEWSDS